MAAPGQPLDAKFAQECAENLREALRQPPTPDDDQETVRKPWLYRVGVFVQLLRSHPTYSLEAQKAQVFLHALERRYLRDVRYDAAKAAFLADPSGIAFPMREPDTEESDDAAESPVDTGAAGSAGDQGEVDISSADLSARPRPRRSGVVVPPVATEDVPDKKGKGRATDEGADKKGKGRATDEGADKKGKGRATDEVADKKGKGRTRAQTTGEGKAKATAAEKVPVIKLPARKKAVSIEVEDDEDEAMEVPKGTQPPELTTVQLRPCDRCVLNKTTCKVGTRSRRCTCCIHLRQGCSFSSKAKGKGEGKSEGKSDTTRSAEGAALAPPSPPRRSVSSPTLATEYNPSFNRQGIVNVQMTQFPNYGDLSERFRDAPLSILEEMLRSMRWRRIAHEGERMLVEHALQHDDAVVDELTELWVRKNAELEAKERAERAEQEGDAPTAGPSKKRKA